MLTAALTFKHEKTFMWSHSSYQRYFVEPSLSHQVNGRLVKERFFSVYLTMFDYRCKQTFSPVLSLLDNHIVEQILYVTNKVTNNNNNNKHTSEFAGDTVQKLRPWTPISFMYVSCVLCRSPVFYVGLLCFM